MHIGGGSDAQTLAGPAGSADKEQHAHAVFGRGSDAYDGDREREVSRLVLGRQPTAVRQMT